VPHGEFSEQWEADFLHYYAQSRNKLEACDLAGVSPSTLKSRIENCTEFAQEVKECEERYEEQLREIVTARLKDPNVSDKFLMGFAAAVLPEWKGLTPNISVTTVVVTPAEKNDYFTRIEEARRLAARQ
jgi:hypothetical protein